MDKISHKVDTARTNLKIAVALDPLTASEISVKADLSVNVLGKFLRKETMISFAGLLSVCEVLGIPLSLITSEQQITPARIRLHKIMAHMTDGEVMAFIEHETANRPSN
jgi:hypothetical protein